MSERQAVSKMLNSVPPQVCTYARAALFKLIKLRLCLMKGMASCLHRGAACASQRARPAECVLVIVLWDCLISMFYLAKSWGACHPDYSLAWTCKCALRCKLCEQKSLWGPRRPSQTSKDCSTNSDGLQGPPWSLAVPARRGRSQPLLRRRLFPGL